MLSVITEPYKTAIAKNPVRLMEGTFHISYERSITSRIGLSISGLAKYDNEEGFTKYKSLANIDFSEVMPTAGISIGILK